MVDYIRVTHPCAGRRQVLLLALPLDLHVLSLPLAFILSQDQTLHSKFDLKCLRFISQSSQLWDTHYRFYFLNISKNSCSIFFIPFSFRFGSAKLILFFKPPNFFLKSFQHLFLFTQTCPLIKWDCKYTTF